MPREESGTVVLPLAFVGTVAVLLVVALMAIAYLLGRDAGRAEQQSTATAAEAPAPGYSRACRPPPSRSPHSAP